MSLVGFYFLFAAALKLFSSSVLGNRYSPTMQFLALQFEIILGIWLILAWWKVTLWLSSVLFLFLLLCIDIFWAIQGQSDCGCFGDLKVHPVFTALMNVTAIFLLAFSRPAKLWSDQRSLVAVALLICVSTGLAWFANTQEADRLLIKWRYGGNVILSSNTVDAGNELVGTIKLLPLKVRNVGIRDVRIMGGSSDCSCTTTRNLPVTVTANSEIQIELQIEFRGTQGRFAHSFELMIMDDKLLKLHGTIVGRVVETALP